MKIFFLIVITFKILHKIFDTDFQTFLFNLINKWYFSTIKYVFFIIFIWITNLLFLWIYICILNLFHLMRLILFEIDFRFLFFFIRWITVNNRSQVFKSPLSPFDFNYSRTRILLLVDLVLLNICVVLLILIVVSWFLS